MTRILKSGNFRGDKVLYPDGIGCSIWTPFDDDENSGMCFDFSYEDIDNLIGLLELMKVTEAEVFVENKDE